MSKYLFFLSFFLLTGWNVCHSQTDPEAPADTILTMQVEEPNKFSFLFQRGIFLQSNSDDPAPIGGTAGSWYVGLGFKFPFAKNKLGFRIQPGISWLKLPYDQNSEGKTFPDTLSHKFQKHRVTYGELPIGLYYNITLDDRRNAKVFVEAGGYIGYTLGGIQKYQDDNVGQQPVTTKISNIQDLESLQYGFYGRVGYKFVALTFTYRLTEVFVPKRTDLLGNVIGTNPIITRPQLALTIFL